jgi:hypothetical protein
VSYIVRDGELMKYNVAFTSFADVRSLFRVVQRFLGIHGANVTYGDVEDAPINGSREFIAPFFAVSRNEPVLSVYLQDLGQTSLGGWVSDKLEKITLSASAEGIDAEVLMGNYSLGRNEALTIDPLVTTVPVIGGNDDTWIAYLQWDPDESAYINYVSDTSLRFGKNYDYYGYYTLYTYNSFLRWPILIPDGCVVQSAYLNICAASSSTELFNPRILTIDSGNCPPFTGSAQDIWNYGSMPNYVTWQLTNWTQDYWYQKYVTQNLQDFMNRQDYALGNYIGLRIDDTGATPIPPKYRVMYSCNAGASKAPRLHITFQAQSETFAEPLENWSFEDSSGWSTDNLLLSLDEGAGKTAYDGGPNTNDGTLMAHLGTLYNMEAGDWVDGRYGKALCFDGTNEYVSVPDADSLDFGTSSFSLSLWIKAPEEAVYRQVIDKATAGAEGWSFYRDGGNPKYLRGFIRDSAGHIAVETWNDAGCTVFDDSWHHVVIVVDRSAQKLKVYVDGVKDSHEPSTSQVGSVSNSLALYLAYGRINNYLNGKLDDIRVYRRALSGLEASSLYGGADIRNGLVAEWRLDEGSGTGAADTHMWAEGKAGSALCFDGASGDEVQVADASGLKWAGGDFNVSLWFKLYPSDAGGGYMLSKPITSMGHYNYWLRRLSDDTIQFTLQGDAGGGWTSFSLASEPVSENEWHSVLATVDGSTKAVKLYVDGVLVASGTHAFTSYVPGMGDQNRALTLGNVYPGEPPADGYLFKGCVDEVRISDGKTSVSVSDDTYMHGKHSWNVEGPSSGDAVVSQLLDTEVTEYVRNHNANQNRGVAFSFNFLPDGVNDNDPNKGEKNKARAEIDYYDGSWHTITNDTIKPSGDWYMAQANCRLPTATTQLKVRIRGYPYNGEAFKAWIDGASLSVYYEKRDVGDYGNVTLLTHLFHSAAMQIPEFDGFVSAAVSVAVSAKDDYSVYRIKDLKVELLPNSGPGTGSATIQQGRLMILYCTQENEEEVDLNPGAQEELINSNAHAALLGGKFIFSTLWGIGSAKYGVPYFTSTLVKAGLATTAVQPYIAAAFIVGGALISIVWPVYRVDLHDPFAEGVADYYVKEDFDYTQEHSFVTYDDGILWSNPQYYFDWRFRTDSDDIFAIKISVTVDWAKWTWDEGQEMYIWEHQTGYVTTLSSVISIANYWQ